MIRNYLGNEFSSILQSDTGVSEFVETALDHVTRESAQSHTKEAAELFVSDSPVSEAFGTFVMEIAEKANARVLHTEISIDPPSPSPSRSKSSSLGLEDAASA